MISDILLLMASLDTWENYDINNITMPPNLKGAIEEVTDSSSEAVGAVGAVGAIGVVEAPRVVLPPSVYTSRYIPGWRITGMWPRKLYHDHGQVLAKKHQIFREDKPSRITKRNKKLTPDHKIISQYTDPRLVEWQNELSKYIHQGNHVVVDVTTSCGKTWATNQIITYETLSDDNATAIFVAPNPEIMRDNVADIRLHNYKYYVSASSRMIDTQTRSYSTYDERNTPSSQIICLTADNFVNFVTNELNHEFISKLKFIVFDEVHLNDVSTCMWWASYLPQTAQFILLSATLGDVGTTIALVQKIAPYKPVVLVEYHIRPIPLQYSLFKGCDNPVNGFRCSTLKAAKRIMCQVNPYDLTKRDIISIDPTLRSVLSDPTMTRATQYALGQELMAKTDINSIVSLIDKDLEDAVVEPTPQNLYNLLCYLFTNTMQPAMLFHTSAATVQDIAKKLVAHISSIEESDPLFRKASRATMQMEKLEKRKRDELAELEEKQLKSGAGFNEEKDDNDTNELAELAANLDRWKFPSQFGEIPTNIPTWIQDCLKYGIGIYLKSFPAWLRYKMFDALKEGKLQVMIADSSVAVGINLPFRTTILCGDITPTLFKQMGGRAGRWGFDDQGYVISMFNKDRIKECYLSASTPVSITVPTEMTYTELIRLLTPHELSTFYNPGPGDMIEPKMPCSILTECELLKKIITKNYLKSISDNHDLMMKSVDQANTIRSNNWHYHRLTHLIQALPSNSETIIFFQLLINGNLSKIDTDDFIDLLSYLFQRKPPSNETDIVTLNPTLESQVKIYNDYFKIGGNFTKPVSNYFSIFCKTGVYDIKNLDNIEQIGEWLYVLNRYINGETETDKKTRKPVLKIYSIVPADSPFRVMVNNVDSRFVAAKKVAGLL